MRNRLGNRLGVFADDRGRLIGKSAEGAERQGKRFRICMFGTHYSLCFLNLRWSSILETGQLGNRCPYAKHYPHIFICRNIKLLPDVTVSMPALKESTYSIVSISQYFF